MITSKLTSKAQTTIPQAVRVALGLFHTFTEWDSEADRRACVDL